MVCKLVVLTSFCRGGGAQCLTIRMIYFWLFTIVHILFFHYFHIYNHIKAYVQYIYIFLLLFFL